ncbi:MAG TPA: patatin-like phospholipase family protein [Archangium sp.]|jgi:NTE family protein|uniref:patatin-like phospholipase family protein n=1 Tax=Archangium sp. TaxID=1872627 RepID=UPI002EDA3921
MSDESNPEESSQLKDGMALCLSGGGYRAMLFHVGSLWRLNELGYLGRLQRVSSVSGGSIVAGLLGLRWRELDFSEQGVSAHYVEKVVEPLRKLAGKTLDVWSILGAVFSPDSVGERVADGYREHLFGEATLQDLPDDSRGEGPRFVINASNVQSGALWRFSRPFMRDYKVGEVKNPRVELAVAVAASSAFPPFLSPMVLQLDPASFTPNSGASLQREPFTRRVILTDGGVYDNLGLETVWKQYKTVLVSDGGGQLEAEEEPAHDWPRHAYRILDIIDSQVRNLRMKQVVGSLDSKARQGAFWHIRMDTRRPEFPGGLACPYARTQELANTPTRLKALEPRLQERLINWGYGACDLVVRRYMDTQLKPGSFPYPEAKV